MNILMNHSKNPIMQTLKQVLPKPLNPSKNLKKVTKVEVCKDYLKISMKRMKKQKAHLRIERGNLKRLELYSNNNPSMIIYLRLESKCKILLN